MDPLNIVSAAASLVAIAFRASKRIYGCVDDIRSVDVRLLQLHDEVNALRSGLESIAATFQSDDVIQFCNSQTNTQPQSVKMLVGVKPLLEDCEKTLEYLDSVLEGIEETPGPKPLRQPVTALKINLKSGDIESIRQQIRSYRGAMQLTLQMVEICLSINGNKQVEALGAELNYKLARLAVQITDVQRKLCTTQKDATQNGRTPVTNDPEMEKHAQHLEEYIQCAKTVYSNATVYAGSTSGTNVEDSFDIMNLNETFGSVLGLNDDHRYWINQWLPSKVTTEDVEGRTDDEAELNATKFDARLAIAKEKLKARDFKAAETWFRSCLLETAKLKTLPLHTIIDLKLELCSIYGLTWNFEAQQAIFLELLELDISKAQEAHFQHRLATAYLNDLQLESAREFAEAAVVGRKRLLGQHHESYYESLSLLVDICKAANDFDEADVYQYLLPLEFRRAASLNFAKISKNASVMKVLSNHGYDGYDINNEKKIFIALEWAAEACEKAVVNFLLDRGLDVIEEGESEYSLLHFASNFGRADIVRLILDRGANINQVTKYGTSILHPAIEGDHETVVRLLLDRGILVDTKGGEYENTPIILASIRGNLEIIRLLLDRGAEINYTNNHSWTPLMHAVFDIQEAAVQLLLERGADPHVKANLIYQGFRKMTTPLEFAKEMKKQRLDNSTEEAKNEAIIRMLKAKRTWPFSMY